MKAEIEAAFPICTANGCTEHRTNEVLYINDPQQKAAKCMIVADKDSANFTVFNPDKKLFTFIAIDHCIWGDDSEHKKCDFAVTDDVVFAFVEIKDVHRNVSKNNRINAKEQLEDTIKAFIINGLDLSHLTRKAIIGWRFKKTYPAATSTMQSAVLHLLNNYQVDLMEGDSFSF